MNMAFSAAAVLAALLVIPALSGCARISPPGPDLAARLAYDQAAREYYRLDQEWWKVYQDERLNALVESALKNNLDLAKAAVNVNRALHQAGLVGADLWPAFSGTFTASTRRNLGESSPSERAYGGQIGPSYEVDLWRRLARAKSAAHWEHQATIEDREAARLTLVNKVVDAYHQLAYLAEAVAATETDLKNLKSMADMARARFRAGKTAALEPAQAEQAVINAQNSLISHQNQFEDTCEAMKNFLNLKPYETLNMAGLTLDRTEPSGADLNIPLSVLANRPDLKAAEFRLHRALANVEAAERAWLPSITLSAALSASASSLGRVTSQPVGSAGLNLNLPFLDWGRVTGRLRVAETDYETARLDFEAALTTALNDVEAAHRRFGTARETLANARRKHAQDVKISGYFKARYQSGAAELSDWLNALNTANASRLALLSALHQLLASESQVWQALGGRYLALEKPLP
jgi:NodT family efflux transporter outer membrane factor (OMF) lipoprotein